MGGLGVALLALTLLLAACEAGSPTTPDYLPTPGDGNPGTGGTGGGSAAAKFVGTWEATTIIDLPANDFITTETTWIFKANTECLQTIRTEQFSEGITYTTVRACTYSIGLGVVHVLYEGAMAATDYLFEFPLNDPDILILQGITYERIT
jgi:hypothetical protein